MIQLGQVQYTLEEFEEYLSYYNNKRTKKIHLNDEFKILNWFKLKIKHNIFYICKTRSYLTNTTNYYYFNYYNYYMCLDTELIEEFKEIKDFIDIYKIGNYTLYKNFREISVRNNSSIVNFDFVLNQNNLIKLQENNDIYNNIYLFKTILTVNGLYNKSIIEQNFSNRFFFVLNNINPGGSYKIDLDVVDLCNNCYFVDDNNISNFFSNIIEDKNCNINILSFDIEVQTNNGKFPEPNKNPISHIGFEIYSNNIKKCGIFINKDIINNFENNHQLKTDYYLKNDDVILTNEKTLLKFILNPDYIFIYTNEKTMLMMIKLLLEYEFFDYILTYNGNKFDYPFINARLEFYNMNKIYSKHLNISSDLIFKTRYLNFNGKKDEDTILSNNSGVIFFDLYNYVKQNFQSLEHFSLEYFSIYSFKIKCLLELIENDKIKITPLKTNNKYYLDIFYSVLKTSNYCFINNNSYPIINKILIIDEYTNNNIYNENIDYNYFIVENKNLDLFENNNTLDLDVSLSKDDVNIGDKDAYSNYDMNKAFNYAKYCIHDAKLCRHLFEKNYIHYFITSSASTYLLGQSQSFIYRNTFNSLGIILRELMDNKLYIHKKESIDYGEFFGGKVLDPTEKYIQDYVLCFDFQSLYPNIIIYHNISPETILLILQIENNIMKNMIIDIFNTYFNYKYYDYTIIEQNNISTFILFDKRRVGLIPSILKKGLQKRLDYKEKIKENKNNIILTTYYDRLQYVTKIFINSIYGLLSSKFFIFYCKFCAQSCTYFSREKLTFVINVINNSYIINNYWYPNQITHIIKDKKIEEKYFIDYKSDKRVDLSVVYGDTDSTMIKVKDVDLVNTTLIGFEMFKLLNKHILHNIILFEFESIYKNMILLNKKKYNYIKIDPNDVLNCMNENNLKNVKEISSSKGTSIIRRDYSKFHKTNLNNILKIINQKMTNKESIDSFDDDIIKLTENIIKNEIKNIYNGTFDVLDYILTRKYLGNYKSFEYFLIDKVNEFNVNPENQNKITVGDRLQYIYIVPFNKQKIDNENYKVGIEWNYKISKTDINKKMYLLDLNKPFIPENNRIAIEIYILRFLKDIFNYIINKKKIEYLLIEYFNSITICET